MNQRLVLDAFFITRAAPNIHRGDEILKNKNITRNLCWCVFVASAALDPWVNFCGFLKICQPGAPKCRKRKHLVKQRLRLEVFLSQRNSKYSVCCVLRSCVCVFCVFCVFYVFCVLCVFCVFCVFCVCVFGACGLRLCLRLSLSPCPASARGNFTAGLKKLFLYNNEVRAPCARGLFGALLRYVPKKEFSVLAKWEPPKAQGIFG